MSGSFSQQSTYKVVYLARVDAAYKGVGVGNGPAGGVYHDGRAAKCGDIGIVEQMACGGVERRVHGDNVGALRYLVKCRPVVAALGGLSRRVVYERLHAHPARPTLHDGANMAHADNAYGVLLDGAVSNGENRRHHILRHSRGVASRSVYGGDAPRCAVGEVDMVGADCGRAYETALRAVEQGRVAAVAGAYKQSVGLLHAFGRYFFRSEIFHRAELFEHPFYEAHVALHYDMQVMIVHR